jgi:hypothetical protein
LIKILPKIDFSDNYCPVCSKLLENKNDLIWQGVHICTDSYCNNCSEEYICNLSIGQSKLESYQLRKSDGKTFGSEPYEWLVNPLKNIIIQPRTDSIKLDIEIRESDSDKIIVLNTLDNCYGHSLLFFLNLHDIIRQKKDKKVIVIIQPFLKWLLPKEGIAEVWTVSLSFNQLREYHSDLTYKINKELLRFKEVYISSAPLCPNEVTISKFSKIEPYNFDDKPSKPKITFIWREDVNRFWFKSYWLYGGLRKLGLATIILPFHYIRILLFLYLMNFKLKGKNYQITLAGLGQFGWFPNFIEDHRVKNFNKESEIYTCKVYAESELVVGVHGSSMILPSAHAGMTVSIMPLKRWGNFIEDILYSEEDVRLAAFQKRVIPMNTTLLETVDICTNMLMGRDTFVRKFIYDKNKL